MKGFQVHVKAFEIIFKEHLKGKFLLFYLPGLFMLLIYLYLSNSLSNFGSSIEFGDNFLADTLETGLKKTSSFLSLLLYQFFLFIVLTLFSPINALFSEKLDTSLTETNFKIDIFLFIKNLVRTILLILTCLFIELILFFIWWVIASIIGLDFLSPYINFAISAFFLGFFFYDYSLERYDISTRASLQFAKDKFATVLLTGVLFKLIYHIPFIGIVVAPVLITGIATIIFLIITKRMNKNKSNYIL
jgi:CysZ protein